MHNPELRNAAVRSVLDKACGSMVYIKVVLEHMAAVGEVSRGDGAGYGGGWGSSRVETKVGRRRMEK